MRRLFKLRQFDSYWGEAMVACFVVAYIVNIFLGKRKNSALAVAFTTELLAPGSVIDRNFAVATGEVLSQGPDLFKVYASGRRLCKGMLLTFRLARRHDLTATIVGAAQRDILDVEVAMNEGVMQPLVLFIGCPGASKVIPKEHEDIEKYARRLEVTRDRLAAWPGTGPTALSVWAEHPGMFYDIVSPQLMEVAFGPAAFAEVEPYFRYVHATTDYSAGQQKSLIRVSFYLPPLGDTTTLARMLTLATQLIDLLGTYKLAPEALKKAQDNRRRAEARSGDAEQAAQRRLEERRQAKDAEERARLAKLPPDQREKERAKRDRILRQRKLNRMAKK